MAQLFHPSANTIAKATIVGGGAVFVFLIFAASWYDRSPYITGVGVPIEQPVPFSHEHHAHGLGIDCRYCHTSVESSSFAGLPATHTCMTCHSKVWFDSPTLEPVRRSFADDKPIEWVRVDKLPQFVYFDHGIHVNKGVGCSTCHGRVDRMPLTWKTQTLHMEWCLDCHRNPERNLRPKEQIFDMAWEPPGNQAQAGAELARNYHLNKEILTNCSTCHR